MSQLTIKPRDIPIIFAAIILIALIAEGYLDQHQWVIWLTIAAIPTWIILGKRKAAQKPDTSPPNTDQHKSQRTIFIIT